MAQNQLLLAAASSYLEVEDHQEVVAHQEVEDHQEVVAHQEVEDRQEEAAD